MQPSELRSKLADLVWMALNTDAARSLATHIEAAFQELSRETAEDCATIAASYDTNSGRAICAGILVKYGIGREP